MKTEKQITQKLNKLKTERDDEWNKGHSNTMLLTGQGWAISTLEWVLKDRKKHGVDKA
jgi:hypothetical protein